MTQNLHHHTFDNGLTLLAEPMRGVESAAFTILMPAGAIYDPQDRFGLAGFTCEMTLRGCGSRDARKFIDDLETLGVEHGEGVSDSHTSFGGATLAENIPAALEIFADLVRRPHLPEDKIEPSRQVMFQELRGIEDDPAQKAMQELKRRHLPSPFGKPASGDVESVTKIQIDDVRKFYENSYRPNGCLIGFAGRIDWDETLKLVEKLFGDWQPGPERSVVSQSRIGGYANLPYDSNQTQVSLAYPSVPYAHEDYYRASASVGVLSSGMSARLFTEVREKRGLCYSVYASYHSLKKTGSVFCYAGTSADRAQETLDVTIQELERLSEGIEDDELDRLKARVRSALVMQQESTSARTAAIVRDWYFLNRIRSLEEIESRLEALTRDDINDYVAKHPAQDFTVVTLGPSPLEVNLGVSASEA
ncbi:MAG: insulinase family protein [Pirellulales bacterium]|nr:insulinase family protein [Pirellulales bacterium]